MFVDREAELADWERRLAGGDAELLVLWGRRRVGKTELAARFCAGCTHVAYTAAPVRERVRPAVFSHGGFVPGLARSAAARGVQLVPGSAVFR
ncbi:MAG: ATP-binding protein [Deltaproteobacteria bacterium]|nr:ATP-binding protein [Deltaproteobacteria bacterium]